MDVLDSARLTARRVSPAAAPTSKVQVMASGQLVFLDAGFSGGSRSAIFLYPCPARALAPLAAMVGASAPMAK